MNKTQMTRRGFLKAGCLAASVLAAPKFFYDAHAASSGKALVVVFLRGGFDGLNFLIPTTGADRSLYEAARPNIKIPVGQAWALSGTGFGLHPAARELWDLYNQPDSPLAIVRSFGLTQANFSHFDAQNKLDLGIVENADLNIGSGLLTRAFRTGPHGLGEMPLLAACNATPQSVLGMEQAVTMSNPQTFSLNSHTGNKWQSKSDAYIDALWSGTTASDRAGTQAVRALQLVNADTSPYADHPDGTHYSTRSRFGAQLHTVFQTLQQGLCTYAQVDKNGWDCHGNQGGMVDGVSPNFFAEMVGDLSAALAGFYADLEYAGLSEKVTTLVYSEFGRRVNDNGNGTDHGRGGVALALGRGVNGGKLHGRWDGLGSSGLDNGNIRVNHDYRQLLSEALVDRIGFATNMLRTVFPRYQYAGAIGGGAGVFKAG